MLDGLQKSVSGMAGTLLGFSAQNPEDGYSRLEVFHHTPVLNLANNYTTGKSACLTKLFHENFFNHTWFCFYALLKSALVTELVTSGG